MDVKKEGGCGTQEEKERGTGTQGGCKEMKGAGSGGSKKGVRIERSKVAQVFI